MKEIDVRKIAGIHYIVNVGQTSFEFDSGTAALKFADTARCTCNGKTWFDEPYEVTIHLYPVFEKESEEPEEEPEVDEE